MSARLRLLLLGCSLAALPCLARAQDSSAPPAPAGASSEVTEVVVTAQKRSERVLRVPINITAIAATRIATLNLKNVQDLTAYVPSFRVTEPGDPAVSALSLRGVGQRDINVQNEGAVAMFVDQAYVSFIPAVAQPLFDVDRIEVLKGPQGTLFGRNATGGLISVISKPPTDTLQEYFSTEYGSYNQSQTEAAIGGGVANGVSARASIDYSRADGYVHNSDGPALNADNSLAGRLQIKFEPNDKFSYLVSVQGWRFFDSPSVAVAPTPFVQAANGAITSPTSYAQYAAFCAHLDGGVAPPVGAQISGNCFTNQPNRYSASVGPDARFNQSHFNIEGTGEWRLNDGVTLTSITDYQHLSNDFLVDETATPESLFNYEINDKNSNQVSQELRLNGATPTVKWVGGLYFLSIDHDILVDTDLYNDPAFGVRLPAAYQQHTQSYAVFGQADVDLASQLTLSLGLRGLYDHKTLNNDSSCIQNPLAPAGLCTLLGTVVFPGALAFNRTYDGSISAASWSGRSVLEYKPTDSTLIYGGVTRGTKGGGFNSGGAEFYPLSAVIFKPETLINYEAGIKTVTLDRMLTVDGSVFYYDYHDYQSFAATTDGGLRVLNVDATVKGAELALTLRPVHGFMLMGSGSYLDTLQKNVPLPTGGSGDFQIPDAPKWSLNGEVRYGVPIRGDDELAVQLNAVYVGQRSISAIDYPDERIPAYNRFDARISYQLPGNHVTLAAFADNFTNQTIIATRVDFTSVMGSAVDTLDPPRWFGVSVTYKY